MEGEGFIVDETGETKVFFFISEKSKDIDLKPFQDSLSNKNIKTEKVKWPKSKTKRKKR